MKVCSTSVAAIPRAGARVAVLAFAGQTLYRGAGHLGGTNHGWGLYEALEERIISKFFSKTETDEP